MRNVFLIGAGRSSSYLINYLLEHAKEGDWTLTVADVSIQNAKEKIKGHPAGRAIEFDMHNDALLSGEVSRADLVISMLPAHMHLPVALECVKQKKNLVTASYVTKEMHDLDSEARQNDIIILNECGLDPGIDHMSAMKVIHELQEKGARLNFFKSFTGGLVAPESNDNPWGYKFSWNPRNVILAGQGTAKYIEDGQYKYIPYSRLFSNAESFLVEGHGSFDGYANRDSLAYRKIYGLNSIPTLLRGTLRQQGFCKKWNVFVQLGLTDDGYQIEDSEHLTYKSFVEAFLPKSVKGKTVRERVAAFMQMNVTDPILDDIEWTGIFSDSPIRMKNASPAQILQQLLEEKWKLKESDKDLIVMQHLFGYTLNSKNYVHTSSLVVKGENSVYTGMAKTVGLPVAIAARCILKGEIKLNGIQVPVLQEIYQPVLRELSKYGIVFKEQTKEL
ncbi:MAG TPA: saccharopine dehydrogenase C-terminal domain-containing protein, partial [Bacteroidia bacterium]|nr:saccharopine dehydrogenase C-terminal domain-containing protein [Bacteroidia bacterium]